MIHEDVCYNFPLGKETYRSSPQHCSRPESLQGEQRSEFPFMVLLLHGACALDLEMRLGHGRVWADGHSCAQLLEGSRARQPCRSSYPMQQIIILVQIRLGKASLVE